RQTPPPEVLAQSRQWSASQSGSATSAVTRLAVLFVAPEKDVTPGCVALSFGPYCFHFGPEPRKLRPCTRASLARRRASARAIRLKVALARATTRGGIVFAGYVRAACR